MMHRNLDLGMEKMCKNAEKSVWKEREKVFHFNKLFYIIIVVFFILYKIFRLPWLGHDS